MQMRVVPMFYHKLSSMLAAGMSLEAALLDLSRNNRNRAFGVVLKGLCQATAAGEPISNSMRFFPRAFMPLHVELIKAAENAGRLPETLENIACDLDARLRMRRKIIRATIYPCIVLSVALIVVTLMLIFVMPAFQEMYTSCKTELPRPTKILLNIRDVVIRYGWYFPIGIMGLIILNAGFKATAMGKILSDWFRLHLPIAGKLNKKIATVRFARTYAQMLRAGVPVVSALKLAGRSTGNAITEQVLFNASAQVENGDPLSGAMQSQKVFPEELVSMLQSGEKTGNIDELMDHIAKLFDEEVSTTLDGLTTMLQPFLIVILGIVIGGLAIAMLMPLFQMANIVGM